MKKIVTTSLTFIVMTVMLCVLFAFSVSAASPEISASVVEAKAGETADITLTLKDNPGLIVMRLSVGYNDDYFSVKTVKDGGLLGDNIHSTNRDKSPYTLYWNNPLLTTNIHKNGDIVTLTFDIDENTPNGTYKITIDKKNSDILTTDLKKIGDNFETVAGYITVSGGKTPAPDTSDKEDTSDKDDTSSEDVPTLKLNNKTVTAGNEFTLTLSLADNPGVIALRTMLKYNDKYFTIKKVVDHDILGESFFSDDLSAEPFTLYWSNPLLTKNITKNGSLVSITFECDEDTPAGKYNFTLSSEATDIVNTDLDILGEDFDFIKGVVTVKAAVEDKEEEKPEEKPEEKEEDTNNPVEKTYTVELKDNRVIVKLSVESVSYGEGRLINLDEDVIKAALSDAAKKYAKKPVDVIALYSQTDVDNIIVNFPKGYASVIKDVDSFAVDTHKADLKFDTKAISEIAAVGDSVQFIIGDGEPSDEVKKLIKNEYVYYDVTSTVEFKDGRVIVTLPYEATSETLGKYAVVYAVEDGELVHAGDTVSYTPGAMSFTTRKITPYVVTIETLGFKDVENHWARENINFVAARGIFNGKSEDTFDPDGVLSRGMLVTVLGRLEKVDISGFNCMFDDVDKNLYYAPYIEWARQNNIVGGVGDNRFEPDRSVTRQEIAVIVARYLEYKGKELKVETIKYNDEAKIDSWAKDAVYKAGNAGIITGVGEEFLPKDEATRAQAATILKRIIVYID